MINLTKYLYSTLSTAMSGFGSSSTTEQDDFCNPDKYEPSVSDVVDVKEALHKKSTLPYELVDVIVDIAEYWPHTTSVTPGSTMVRSEHDNGNQFILRSYPLGFLPRQDNQDQYQLLPDYDQKYKTMDPHPWPESRHVPDNATEEVISNWTLKSLTRGGNPCRKIVFTISSHDQGWGGTADQRGTFTGSYTWFDVGLERFSACRETELSATMTDASELAPWPQFRLTESQSQPEPEKLQPTAAPPIVCSLRTLVPSATPPRDGNEGTGSFVHPLLPSQNALQKNVTASRETREYIIEWRYDDNITPDSVDAVELETLGRGRATADGNLVRDLKVGDTVTVWAKARFPGWVNFVEEVKVDVYWAV